MPNPEQRKILIEIVNKVRILKCWDILPADKALTYANTWGEILLSNQIPSEYWHRLYRMCVDHQVFCRDKGLEVPDITADLMVFRWKVLKEQLKEEEIKRGRTLGANAESICRHCFGSGWREVTEGDYKAVKKCNHEEV